MNSGPNPRSKGPELLLDLVYQSADLLQKMAGLPPGAAQDIAVALATRMAESWGGQSIYFPKGTWNGRAALCFKLEERDWKIYREYNGTNREEVCARHGISTPRLYQVIAAIHKRLSMQTSPISKNAVIDG